MHPKTTVLKRSEFMLARVLFIVLVLTIPKTICAQQYPQNDFIKPLDIPIILSGTYGELRSNHFHAGIDIKTNGVEGLRVKAAARGEVVRIAVSPHGYGNALYIRHPNGYTTVYAHLQRFTEHIADWVEKQQYQQKSFQVNLFPPAGTFPVEQGDVIALSGNSGGSGGPHLHFEIRDSRTEEPINPLLFGIEVPDHRHPEIRGVYAYPLTAESHLNQRNGRTSLSTKTLSNGSYAIRWPQRAEGQIGFAIDVIDRLDGAWNSNGPYRIVQYVNDRPVSEFVMERFAFSETRFLNAHIDFNLYECCGNRVNRMWVLPGNNLRAYRQMENSGIITVDSDSSYQLRWEIYDVAGNKTTLTGTVNGESRTATPPAPPSGTLLSFDQPNFGSVGAMRWQMEAGTLYEDITVETEVESPVTNGYGNVYRLGDPGIPVHTHYTLKLPLDEVPAEHFHQAVVVSLDDNNRPDSWDGTITSGKLERIISARVRTLGRFTVMIDSVPPVLSVRSGIRNGAVLRPGSEIRVKMTDDLSGVDKYECLVDGSWYLMSFDAKNNALAVELKDDIEAGEHTIVIRAEDDRGNETKLEYSFTFQKN